MEYDIYIPITNSREEKLILFFGNTLYMFNYKSKLNLVYLYLAKFKNTNLIDIEWFQNQGKKCKL